MKRCYFVNIYKYGVKKLLYIVNIIRQLSDKCNLYCEICNDCKKSKCYSYFIDKSVDVPTRDGDEMCGRKEIESEKPASR